VKIILVNFWKLQVRGYGGETKGDETKIRKLWRNASHISSVESNNFRNFPRSGMGNKNKIK
jgi:hypothetical protein